MRKYTLYCHRTPENKAYIGITSLLPKHRWNSGHGYTGSKFGNAVEEFGWSNIESHILFENLSKDDACRLEILLIKMFDTTNDEFGYNVSSGGEVNYHSLEVREKISKKVSGKLNGMYGSNQSGENNPMYGVTPWNKGIPRTDEVKNKISQKMKGRYVGGKNPNAKAVECITTGKTFPSIVDAANYYNVSKDCIGANCRGRTKSAGRLNGEWLKWRFV